MVLKELHAEPCPGTAVLREVAASDKTWSHQAGDLYLHFLGTGRHLLRGYIRVRTLTQLEVNQR